MKSPRTQANGKQIMFDGKHLADARDPLAAEVIAIMLNHASMPCWIPVETMDKIREFFA